MAESGWSTGLLIGIIVLAIAAFVNALFPFSVNLYVRAGGSAAIAISLLVLAWVLSGGLERRASRVQAVEWAARIQEYPDYPNQLDAFARRAMASFGEDSSSIRSFAYGMLQTENALTSSNATSGFDSDDIEMVLTTLAKIQSIGTGWRTGGTARTECFGEILRLLQGPARVDTSSFIAAYRMTRGLLTSNYAVAQAYVIEARRARPYARRPGLRDDWEKFRLPANNLASEWEQWGMEIGMRVGAEGPYTFPLVLDLGN
jgi:hypothetical protein